MSSLVAKHWPVVTDYSLFPDGVAGVVLAALHIEIDVPLPDAGYGKIILSGDDAYATTPVPGDLFTIDIVGDDAVAHRAFAFIYRKDDYVAIDPSEEAGQDITFEGPGHLSIYSDGRIEPPGGVGRFPTVIDFVFDFTHPGYTEGGDWVAATEVISVEDAQVPGAWGFLQTWTGDMPAHAIAGPGSGTTMILWASDGTPSGTTTAVGSCYFRDTFTTTFDGMHDVTFTVDNVGELWIDGKSIYSAGTGGNPITSGFSNVSRQAVSLSAGEHTIAIAATNFPPFGAPNPGGVAAAVYIYGYPPTLVWESTSAMRIWEYAPETPGMTVGQDERLMTEAQQALGRFGYITFDFDDAQDSATDAWDPVPTIAVKAGADDCYSTDQKIMATYADIVMDPSSWVLHAWNYGGRAPASTVVFEVGNLTALRFVREDKTADELIILSGVGWSRDGTGGRRQGYLELGPENNAEEPGRLGDRALTVFTNPREETLFAYEARNDTELPWVNANFVPGSTVTCPTRAGGTITERAMRIGCTYSKDGERVLVTVSVKDLILQDQERILNALRG